MKHTKQLGFKRHHWENGFNSSRFSTNIRVFHTALDSAQVAECKRRPRLGRIQGQRHKATSTTCPGDVHKKKIPREYNTLRCDPAM